jgi:nucleoside-diphosphate-sugar epimerase
MSLERRRLLLAGGTGLAGSGVLRQVLSRVRDIHVRVPHRGGSGARLDDERVEYVRADLTSSEDCARVAADCDCAVLAAAQTGGAQQARGRPWAQVTDNLVIDARLLEALHEAGVRRAVYVGTASAYQGYSGAIREDQLDWNQDPPAAYLGVGWAKRYAEKLCRFWHQSAGMEILIARLANVYGPHARFDPAASHFVAALVRKAVAQDDPFVVWGDPGVGRDIVYADDFGRAVVAMLEATDIKFDVFNIGSGKVTTVGEVAELALRAAGHTPGRIVYDSASPTTVAHRMLDCSKARDLLGWTPEVSAAEGIRRTVDWWRANKESWKR